MIASLLGSILATCALTSPPSALGRDLTKVERTIVKEATYQTKAPKYCLLVFGPGAMTRVWLVQDGDALYVDRNGDGDLTDDGEKVAAKLGTGTDPEQGVFQFEVGEIRDGERQHKSLMVLTSKLDYLADRDEQIREFIANDTKARAYSMSIDVDMPGWNGAGLGGRVVQLVSFRDVSGFLQFADRPQDAPIIHLGGPWQVTFYDSPPRLRIGRENELVLGVGTPGLGDGTTAFIGYDGIIPENVYPTVDVIYPPAHEGDPPIKELYEIKGRC